MANKADAALAEAARCISIAKQASDRSTKERYLKLAESWRLIADHHDALAEMDSKVELAENEPKFAVIQFAQAKR